MARWRLLVVALAVAVAATGLALSAQPPTGEAARKAKGKGKVRTTGTAGLTGTRRPVRTLRGREPRKPRVRPKRGGQARPVDPRELEEPPENATVPPTEEGPGGARAAAAGDFTIFRNSKTDTSTAHGVEPTAANDRTGILTTGNWFAQMSPDHGLSFEEFEPTEKEVFGGFCCDQVAYAVDRGPQSLVFWLLQYSYDPDAGAQQNALRLRMFRGRDDLVDGSDACDWDFEPQKLGRPAEIWFDYNQMSHTEDFLYITTNARDADAATKPKDPTNDPRVGGMIIRVALDDLDDGNCQITYRYWYEHGEPYISPVQNAGSTMYLAAHVGGVAEGDNLRIYEIADSSTTLEKTDKDIKNFKDISGDCPLPDANDPCEDNHPGRMSGFRSGNTIGWLWMGDEEGDFEFPHVRVAVFETGSLKKVLEHQIHNDAFAWQNPTVGVNQDGDLGVVLYAMGGGRYPKAQGFLRTDPRDWSAIQMNAIATSDSGLPGLSGWGHYASVYPYGNCPQTFLGSVYATEKSVQQARMVWFGAEGDGCIDLSMPAVSAAPGPVSSGDTLNVIAEIQNQGSAAAPASFTGYYLSRDPILDEEDISFETTRAANALDLAETTRQDVDLVVPGVGLGGFFHVIACADDPAAIAEITQTNNCAATAAPLEVQAGVAAQMIDFSTGVQVRPRRGDLKPRASFEVDHAIRLVQGRPNQAPSAAFTLSPTRGRDDDEIALSARTLSTRRARRARIVRVRLTLPARVPPGRYHLVGCLRHQPRRGDARADNDCQIVRRSLRVRGRADTRGPLRRVPFRGE